MMTVAVTGASGHVGGNLVRSLIKDGRMVRVLVREDTRALEGLALERISGDLLDPGSLDRLVRGAEVVYHLAGIISIAGDRGGRVRRVNVEGTRNVVQACLRAGVRRLVHFSSIHALDRQPRDRVVDESRALAERRKTAAYDASKAAAERQVQRGIKRGLDVVIVNPCSVLGPLDYKLSPMGRVLLLMARGRMPALVQGGFNWVDVRDVVQGAVAAEKLGRTGQRYLLGGQWCDMRDLALLVQRFGGARPPRFTSPIWLARLGAPLAQLCARVLRRDPLFTSEALDTLCDYRQVSHERAARKLGYCPRPLAETVRDTLSWFREAGYCP